MLKLIECLLLKNQKLTQKQNIVRSERKKEKTNFVEERENNAEEREHT